MQKALGTVDVFRRLVRGVNTLPRAERWPGRSMVVQELGCFGRGGTEYGRKRLDRRTFALFSERTKSRRGSRKGGRKDEESIDEEFQALRGLRKAEVLDSEGDFEGPGRYDQFYAKLNQDDEESALAYELETAELIESGISDLEDSDAVVQARAAYEGRFARGEKSFSLEYMRDLLYTDDQHLWARAFDEFEDSIRMARPMEDGAADYIAKLMMMWAIKQGARHFVHWSAPMHCRGVSARKLGFFIDQDFSNRNWELSVHFKGSQLFGSEVDGSTLAHGGLRSIDASTAYMTWDKMSPPFVHKDTLFLPSVLVSRNGDALDEKTPLLRSMDTIDKAGLQLLGHIELKKSNSFGIKCNLTWNQQFFLVEKKLFEKRPDLVSCGRCLIGKAPTGLRQQPLAPIPEQVKEIFEAAEFDLHMMNVPVALSQSTSVPGQFEISPLPELVNVAADGNLLAMEILQEKANERGLVALFHEKPFKGLRGSSKHLDWNMAVKGSSRVLLEPGVVESDQEAFIAVLACMMRAVHLYGNLFQASTASLGNDLRLEGEDAPPRALMIHLGEDLEQHIANFLSKGDGLSGYGNMNVYVDMGSRFLQSIRTGLEDKSVAASFPYTGDSFQLRSAGASKYVGFPIACIQIAVADSMADMARRLNEGEQLVDVVKSYFERHLDVVASVGKDWKLQAEERKLRYPSSVAESLEVLKEDKIVRLFESAGVLSGAELAARKTVGEEQLVQTCRAEAECLLHMMETAVLPACAEDLRTYDGKAAALVGPRETCYAELRRRTDILAAVVKEERFDVTFCLNEVKPLLEEIGEITDEAERLVSAGLWPFPRVEDLLLSLKISKRHEKWQEQKKHSVFGED